MSAGCLGELVRKMGERVLQKIIPILQVLCGSPAPPWSAPPVTRTTMTVLLSYGGRQPAHDGWLRGNVIAVLGIVWQA